MTLSPLQDYLVVQLLPPEQKSAYVITLSENGRAQKATVLAIGPEVRDVKVRDTVIVSRLAGMEVQDKVILREGSVLAWA